MKTPNVHTVFNAPIPLITVHKFFNQPCLVSHSEQRQLYLSSPQSSFSKWPLTFPHNDDAIPTPMSRQRKSPISISAVGAVPCKMFLEIEGLLSALWPHHERRCVVALSLLAARSTSCNCFSL